MSTPIYTGLALATLELAMPRKNPVPERERQICQRLRQFRLETKLSQVAFADDLGIDSTTLASYEHGRVPLRYALANTVCRRFDLSQRWLATGLQPKHPYLLIMRPLLDTIPSRMLFSEAYDRFLDDELAKPLSNYHRWKREGVTAAEIAELEEHVPPVVSGLDVERVADLFGRTAASAAREIPPRLYNAYYRELNALRRQFLAVHKEEIEAFQREQKPQKKKGA